MRIALAVSLLAALLSVRARYSHSLPEDTYAYPKYRVAFLNGLPVLNETAERWLKDGLRGGEQEFLDQPWADDRWHPHPSRQSIDSGQLQEFPQNNVPPSPPLTRAANYTLEHMKMGPTDSFLCLIPQPLDRAASAPSGDKDADVTPVHTWSLLQPLSGTCLYHRQGWFTYSYCHNDEIRQFKEMVPPRSRKSGPYIPEEDPEWESYTLGRAPPAPESSVDLTVAEEGVPTANVELAHKAGSRYLVQKWGGGTTCDKTGRRREVEVQFHCSMTMVDHIVFVKETKTCSYVLVVHTPRLCGEPGFKTRRDAGAEVQIRCREVVHTMPAELAALPEVDQPLKVPLRKTVLPTPHQPPKTPRDGKDMSVLTKLFRETFESFLKEGTFGDMGAVMLEDVDGNTGVLIDLDEDVLLSDGADQLLLQTLREGFGMRFETEEGEVQETERKEQRNVVNEVNELHRDEL